MSVVSARPGIRIPAWTLQLTVCVALASGLAACSGEGNASQLPTAAAEVRTIERVESVRGRFGHGALGGIESASEGVVTRLVAAPGDTVDAGDPLLELSGRMIVAWGGDRPFWRELAVDSSGDDVLMLEELLVDMGLLSSPDDDFDAETETAVTAFQSQLGFAQPDGVLRLGDLAFGVWPARVGSVPVRVGDVVGESERLVEFTEPTMSIQVDLTPSQRLTIRQGDRVRATVTATRDVFTGEVVSVATEANVDEAGSETYRATIGLDSEVPSEVDGAAAQVSIVVESAVEVVAVLVSALTVDAEGIDVVFVSSADASDPVERRVEVGLSEGNWVEVRSGVTAGDVVVVAPRTLAPDGG